MQWLKAYTTRSGAKLSASQRWRLCFWGQWEDHSSLKASQICNLGAIWYPLCRVVERFKWINAWEVGKQGLALVRCPVNISSCIIHRNPRDLISTCKVMRFSRKSTEYRDRNWGFRPNSATHNLNDFINNIMNKGQTTLTPQAHLIGQHRVF